MGEKSLLVDGKRGDPGSQFPMSKGSRKNNFAEFAPGFVPDWGDLREHNRRRRMVDVEDCASENRPKLA